MMNHELLNGPDELLSSSLTAVKDEPSFLHFVGLLAADGKARMPLSEKADLHRPDWSNQTIEDFLRAANAWATDAKVSESPGPKPSDLWQLLAKYLWASRRYK
jgi:hypothetical protein